MKKIILYFVPIFAILLLFSGCEKEVTTEDTSSITYYVDLQLEGDDIVTLPQGGTYNEPGFTADEGGTDASGKVQIEGDVDESTIGLYTLNYSVLNEDGFLATTQRTVVVYDPNAPDADISGTYTAKNSLGQGGDSFIKSIAPGIFYVEDMFGGWYEFGRGLGLAYRARTYILLNSDNTFTALEVDTPWGPWDIVNGEYDPSSLSLSHTIVHSSGFGFDVTLEKQ